MSEKIFSIVSAIMLVAVSFFCLGCEPLDDETETFRYENYEVVDAVKLVKAVEVNPAAAAKATEGKGIKIVGARIANIDVNGTQFSLDCGELLINSIVCVVEEDSDAQQELLHMTRGQPIIVYGVVDRVENITNMSEIFSAPTHIGDLYGLIISVEKIERPSSKPVNTHAVKNPKV